LTPRERATILDDDRRGRNIWEGSVADRLRIAEGYHQAVAKVTSYNHGKAAALKRFQYVSRGGEIPLELHDGTMLEGDEAITDLVAHWASDFSTRAKSRDVMSYVVSFPSGVDREAAISTSRECFGETFGDNHEYAFAPHDDADKFHVHLLVKMRGYDGKAMQRTKGDLERWRQRLAEKARKNGIPLDASPRFARGKARLAVPEWMVRMEARGERPRKDFDADPLAGEFQQQLSKANARERVEFAKQAKAVAQEALSISDPKKKLRALDIAAQLAIYAEGMATPDARGRKYARTRRARGEKLEAGWSKSAGSKTVRAEELKRRLDAAIRIAKKKGLGKPGAENTRVLVHEVERLIRKQVSGFSAGAQQREAIAIRAKVSALLREPVQAPNPRVEKLPDSAEEMLRQVSEMKDPRKKAKAKEEMANLIRGADKQTQEHRSRRREKDSGAEPDL